MSSIKFNQQTVTCDFLAASKSVNTVQINTHNLDVKTINAKDPEEIIAESKAIDDLKKEIQLLQKEIQDIKKNIGPSRYTSGRAVTIRIIFHDINLNHKKPEDLEHTIRDAFKKITSRDDDQITLIDAEETDEFNSDGCITVTRVTFPNSTAQEMFDDVNSAVADRENFIAILSNAQLNDQQRIITTDEKGIPTDIFEEYPEYQEYYIDTFTVGPIKGNTAEISGIKGSLSAKQLDFSKSQRLVLDEFKLDSNAGQLLIQRFDETIGQYVGGSIIGSELVAE